MRRYDEGGRDSGVFFDPLEENRGTKVSQKAMYFRLARKSIALY